MPQTSPSVFGYQPHDQVSGAISRVPTGLSVDGAELSLEAVSGVNLSWTVRQLADGVAEVRVTPESPGTVRIGWHLPCVNAVAYWTPDSGRHRGLPPFWGRPHTSSLVNSAPVGSLVGFGDVALCTFAAGEAIRPVRLQAGVIEETGAFGCWVEHEAEPDDGLLLRLDVSRQPFWDSLTGVAAWWQAEAGYSRAEVPRSARMPAYSTWYSMHQYVNESDIERQASASADLNCEVIIVDDGWHSTDRARGYGYVGEWEPNPETFPDFAAHVERVHEQGLAYMLWYSLPFSGRFTDSWERLRPYTLAYKDNLNASVLDPRYPAVRDLIARNLSRPFREWGMDGLKIDFIDHFAVDNPPEPTDEADCTEVVEGVRRLLDQLASAYPQDALVELRQPYVSPGLWPYATMIRASDCPLSPLQNRQRTIDLRLLAGPLAVHADMMMWHPAEPADQVAVQLVNVLFAVPQVSVDLTTQTPEQLAVVRFWLRFCVEHLDVLQHGRLETYRPDLQYPLVRAIGDGKVVVGRYGPLPVTAEPEGELFVANADSSTDVPLVVRTPLTRRLTVHDCQGRVVEEKQVELAAGVHIVSVPVGGLLHLRLTR
ncbi:glycoside hydrolase family 36 protein [Flindersiella endophytica]